MNKIELKDIIKGIIGYDKSDLDKLDKNYKKIVNAKIIRLVINKNLKFYIHKFKEFNNNYALEMVSDSQTLIYLKSMHGFSFYRKNYKTASPDWANLSIFEAIDIINKLIENL